MHFPIPFPPPGEMLGNHWFTGPIFLSVATRAYAGLPGVYVVVSDGLFGRVVLDVGQSVDVGDRLSGHDRQPDWVRLAVGPISTFVHVESDLVQRLRVEGETRGVLAPLVGVR